MYVYDSANYVARIAHKTCGSPKNISFADPSTEGAWHDFYYEIGVGSIGATQVFYIDGGTAPALGNAVLYISNVFVANALPE